MTVLQDSMHFLEQSTMRTVASLKLEIQIVKYVGTPNCHFVVKQEVNYDKGSSL